MSDSQASQFSIFADIPLESVHVDNESDSEFENLSYCSSKNDTPENELHKLFDEFIDQRDIHYNVTRLRKELLISPSRLIDELDKDGVCVLHKILKYFLDLNHKDECGVDVVELTLNKSYLDYQTYKQGVVLTLIRKYDTTVKPESIKYLQWQILSRVGEELIVRWEMSQQKNDKNIKDVKRFVNSVHKTMSNETHLDDMIESILASGSLELLKYVMRLVEDMQVKLVTPMIINAVSWGLFAKQDNVEHFHKCFEHLLSVSDKKVLCMGDENGSQMTALHYADAFNDEFMIRKLLASGAPITAQNWEMKFPVQNISADILREFLDSLVTSTPSRFLEDESVWKVINGIYDDEYKLDGFIFMNFNSFEFVHDACDEPDFNNLELMSFISESPRLCQLIDHPILATMLEMHWRRFKKWILLDQISVLFMLLVLFVSGIKYIVQPSISYDTCRSIDYAIAAVSVVFLIGEIIKNYKVFQLIGMACLCTIKRTFTKSSEPLYVRHFPIYQTITSFCLKIPLLIAIIVYTSEHCDHHIASCRQILGIASILFSMNLTLLVAYFNQTVAHYLIMFLCVAYTGLKFILSMFFILFGFGLGLFMLINNFNQYNLFKKNESDSSDDSKIVDVSTTKNPSANTTEHYDWVKVGLSFFRVFVMSTGELEVSNLIFNGIISLIVFMFFIFVIPIVFFNLLNGLAIEDIAVIKREAMFWYRKTQLMVLNEFQHLYWKVDNNLPCVPYIDISIYPDMIGEKTFIGINTYTREMFKMSGLTIEERERIGSLSKSALSNAQEVLRNQK